MIDIPIPFPAAPRITAKDGISQEDEYCWKVARTAFKAAAIKHAFKGKRTGWHQLSYPQQDTWFWTAKAVLAALDILK